MTALMIAFSPQSSWTNCDPGSGQTITLASTYLRPSELIELGELWARACESMRSLRGAGWSRVLELLRAWVYVDPRLVSGNEEDTEVTHALRLVAGRMLRDVAEAAHDRPGVQQELASYAAAIGTTVPAQLDPDYEVLFPGREEMRRDWQQAEARQLASAQSLAEAWASREPAWVAQRLAHLAAEAALVQNNYPDYTSFVRNLIHRRRAM
jgi:hypothetical protein